MSEDDRAAQAARARALLLKKKGKKPARAAAAAISRTDTASPTPSSPLARTSSPATSEAAVPEDITLSVTSPLSPDAHARDVGDLFSAPAAAAGGDDWLANLDRAGSPSVVSPPLPQSVVSPPPRSQSRGSSANGSPAMVSPPPSQRMYAPRAIQPSTLAPLLSPPASAAPSPAAGSPPASVNGASRAEVETLKAQVESGQQTINLLVAEKASLSAALERLSDVEAHAHDADKLLEKARQEAEALRSRVAAAETEATESTVRSSELARRTKELEDRCKEQERELQLTKGSAEEYEAQATRSARRIRELEEQIQSDDRADRAEAALQNVQERATELEMQLSKLKQTHTTLKTEHEEVQTQLKASKDGASSWEAKHAALRNQHTDSQNQLSALRQELDSLSRAKASAESQLATAQQHSAKLQDEISRVTAEHIASMRQLQSVQQDLRAATRRADEAERTQADLQAEGSRLLAALEEVRPKVVELTDARLALTDRAAALESQVRERDAAIATAEGAEHEARTRAETLEEQLQEALSTRERERADAQNAVDELQREFAEVQAELEDTRAAVRDLEVERSAQRQLVTRQTAELETLGGARHALADELAGVRRELEEAKLDAAEQEDILERARTDLEALRADASAKEAELDGVKAELALLHAGPASPALGEEMLSSLRQQHHLELSAAQSQIRALQTAVFEADARVHTLQRQLGAAHDDLARRAGPGGSATYVAEPRPASRARRTSDEIRSATRRLSSSGANGTAGMPVPGTTQAAFGESISPETRHKRKVSLGMLKARIDSEMLAAAAAATSNPASRAMSPSYLASVPEGSDASGSVGAGSGSGSWSGVGNGSPRKPQFLDEGHIFWCSSCRGELVIL